jgi:hypothetical protein
MPVVAGVYVKVWEALELVNVSVVWLNVPPAPPSEIETVSLVIVAVGESVKVPTVPLCRILGPVNSYGGSVNVNTPATALQLPELDRVAVGVRVLPPGFKAYCVMMPPLPPYPENLSSVHPDPAVGEVWVDPPCSISQTAKLLLEPSVKAVKETAVPLLPPVWVLPRAIVLPGGAANSSTTIASPLFRLNPEAVTVSDPLDDVIA